MRRRISQDAAPQVRFPDTPCPGKTQDNWFLLLQKPHDFAFDRLN